MNGFAAFILEHNRNRQGEIAIVDRNGARETGWDSLRKQIFRVAAYAREKSLSGIVPVCMERSEEAVASVLGLSLAGAGVAPMAESTPAERRENISAQTGNPIWTGETFEQAMAFDCPAGSPFAGECEDYEALDRLCWEEDPDRPAYVVFTSGSTGNPKGVLLNNNAIRTALLRVGSPDFFDFKPDSVTLQCGSLSFIAFVVDMLSPLYAGCRVHFLPESFRGDCGKITEYINRYSITETYMPPQLYRTFEGAPSLRCVYTGTDRIVNLGPKGSCKLKSGYGLSETAGPFISYEIREPMAVTPLGIDGGAIKYYILDDRNCLSDEGELCLSGPVASAYLNLPEKNAETFIPNPFSDDPAYKTLFRTGDIVRRQEDGNLVLINRKDNMLKINGQRVEPGEIELTMLEFGGITLSLVKGFSDDEGRSILVGYYTSPEPIDEEALRQFLGTRLTHYMVPHVFVRLDKMPVNANGKLDRKQLKLPEFASFRNEYQAPETHLEKLLCAAFAKTLQLDKIGVNDDFLSLGGDSVRALEIVKACEKYDVTAADVLEARTPRALAGKIEQRAESLYGNLVSGVDRVPLTDSQMGVYLECILQPDSLMYDIPFHCTFDLPGKLSAGEVCAAINGVLKSHPALYARLEEQSGEVCMVRGEFPAEGLCSCREEDVSEEELMKTADAAVHTSLNLKTGPLCRVTACRSGGRLHLFLHTHHITSDGTSIRILCGQFLDALQGIPAEPEQVDAFSLYEVEKRMLESPAYQEDEAFYENMLGGVETDSTLLPDYQTAPSGSTSADVFRLHFDVPAAMEQLRKSDLTKNTLFMGAFGYTLAKMTGQQECLFTAGESGRKSSLLNRTVSMMVRTLPVVMQIDENRTGREMLKALQSRFFQTIRHDSVSFAALNKKYGVTSDVSFVYQSDLFGVRTVGSARMETEFMEVGDTAAKLNVMVMKEGDGFLLRMEYRKDLYSPETVRRFAELYLRTVDFLLSDRPMKEMPLISEADRKSVDRFNESGLACDFTKTFVDRFRAVAERVPDRTAVVFKDKKYTYRQVDELSDRIAAYVHGKGVGREQTVSVLIPRCEYMAIVSIGVIKAGAIYEPMDPSYPPERLTFMHTDADARLLIADREMIGLLPEYKGEVLFTDEIPALPAVSAEEVRQWAPAPEDTYVLLYTSGTTGKPKGCMLCHRNLTAFVDAHTRTLEVDENSKFSLYPSYGFDAHMADLYPALGNGCELHIIPDEIRLDFPAIKEYSETHGLTHMLFTTQVARQFILEYPQVKHLKYVTLGGESLLSYDTLPDYRVVNLYGPSESTVCVTGFYVDEYRNPIPIGRPLPNCRIYVADPFGRQVPVGVPGELIVSGPQVGKGYLNRPEKTAEVFVPNTYEEDPGENYLRCYRTGDIVRWADDGNLIFIGRRDLQVKIRGFRIELSEVEQVIRSYPGIKDAAVIAAEEKGGKCIHAYVVADTPVDISGLNDFIRSRKPAYMVPAATMQIESIPLTVNQKLDKRKLPPIVSAPRKEVSGAPRSLTLIEEQLMAVLKDIVGECDADVQTLFTDAGITSISSIKLASRIYKQFGLHITSKEILDGGCILSVENAVIRQLLEGGKTEEKKAEQPLLASYPLTQTQTGIYLDSLRAGIGAYNIPLLLKIPEGISLEKLKDAVRRAIALHPSMLCYICTDEKGDPVCIPAPEMTVEIGEEELAEPVPVLTEFSFTRAPLFRVRILHCGGEHYLLLEVHHIIGDGESLTVLTEDIDRAYRGEALEKEEFTAFDLSLQEQTARKGEELRRAGDAYDSILRGVSADYTPCPDLRGENAYAAREIPIAAPAGDVHAFCRRCGITENIFFTAAFALTVARFTFHEDALFATIYNGRVDPRTQRLVSMLVKTLPVYVQAEANTPVADFLKSVESRLNLLRQNDLFSFADAAREYGVGADVMFIYQGKMLSEAKLDGKTLESVPVNFESPKADLSTEIFEKDSGFAVTVEYNAGRYSADWVEGFADACAACVAGLMTAGTLGEVEITSEAALHRFDAFNDTDIEVRYRPVYRRLAEQAEAHPDRIALISSPEDESRFRDEDGNRIYEKLTYAQLDGMTNELARRLIALGVKPGDPVGVMTGRTKEVYLGEFGALKAGCPFVFLSPSYPFERVSYICGEASVKAIVTTHAQAETHEELYAKTGIVPVFADDISPDVRADCPDIEVGPDALAYMIYTSGSTGQPKGVTVTQRGLNNLADNNEKNLQLHPLLADVMCAVSAFTFDASVLDGCVSLANGATLCIATEEDIHNPAEFSRLCLDNGVQSFVGTPSFVVSLLDCPDFEKAVGQLHAICCGGEVYPPMLYEKLKSMNPDICLLNGYGPSETTVCCSARVLQSSRAIDIGTPINNTKIYIVDRQKHILPMGALGELVITGDGVGLGYLNRPDLTEKAFFKLNGVPAYRSGDLALITNTGCIEFHGRIDNQVKLRGLRVELGEIEAAINGCPDVRNSIVLVKGRDNNQYLAAYYTADREIPSEEIRVEISRRLTEYMVPRVFLQLEEMPMTANGKIDKKALPEIVVETAEREYVAPSNPTEEALCKAFADALGLEKVGVTDDFFELGGTSLTATKIAMFAMAHDIRLVYKDVFSNPTVRQLSLLAGAAPAGNPSGDAGEEDTAGIDRALAGNVWKVGDDAGHRPLGNVLLTGATGFLGMHVLKSFLENESGEIYCLMKKGSFDSTEKRLGSVFFYYFEQELPGSRIHCVEGDITDRAGILSLKDLPVDTVLNCAACVKHFANDDVLEKVNVEGVQNLADLCLEKKIRLVHASTISVAGESVNGTPGRDAKLAENQLYIRQTLENRYIRSKFDSEKVVLRAISEGLDGKIMRLGNLMPRFSDGEFQINFLTNGFMRQLRGYHALGCAPYSVLSGEFEFSPIDDTAGAILALAKTDSRLTVFHANNLHRVFMSDVFRAMNLAGLKVDCVSEPEFAQRLKEAMSGPDAGDEVAGLIAYLNRADGEERCMLGYENAFTADVLNRIGFNWNITGLDYLVNAFRNLEGLGFFSGRE